MDKQAIRQVRHVIRSFLRRQEKPQSVTQIFSAVKPLLAKLGADRKTLVYHLDVMVDMKLLRVETKGRVKTYRLALKALKRIKTTDLKRFIATVFYSDYKARKIVKINKSCDPVRASGQALVHLRRQKYTHAVMVEVYELDGRGKLHCVLKRDIRGNEIKTIYQADYKGE